MSELSKEVLYEFLGQAVAKSEKVKGSGQKKVLDPLGLRLRFSQVNIMNCCSSDDPGSIPGRRKH